MAETVLIETPHGPLQVSFASPAKEPESGRAPAILIGPALPGDLLDRQDFEQDLADSLRKSGFAVLACEGGATIPTRAADLLDQTSAAFRWLLLRDDIDSDRVGLFGSGSAAIPIACLAARSDRIAAICLFAPVTTTEIIARSSRPNGKPPLLEPALVAEDFLHSLSELAPVEDLAAVDHPTLILHGAADRTIAPEASYAYLEALTRSDRHAHYELIAHADYELDDPELRQIAVSRTVEFFRANVRTRQKSTQAV